MEAFDWPAIKLSFSRHVTLQMADTRGYDWPMTSSALYPRFAEHRLRDAVSDSPVVLLHGPRQCGKTTLARAFGDSRGYTYVTFDDDVARAGAVADPAGFVADLPDRVILDEVQRVPGLFTSLKRAIDGDRTPGRFILTGSSNVLLVPTLSDSLAGRMEILRLHPLSRAEIARHESSFLDRLFGTGFPVRAKARLGRALIDLIVAGGYPPAIARAAGRRRAGWYRSYIESVVQRDVRDMSRIASLDALPRLLAAAAAQTASLFNAASLSAPFQLSRPTIRDYVTLLERVFLIELLPPWHSNRLSRLVKTPKLHIADSGLAATLLDFDADALASDRGSLGPLLETFVYQEIARQASGRDEAMTFHHFRDRDGAEVDIVIERGARAVAGVEVKASATVTQADFRGLRKLQQACGRKFAHGVVLYDGEVTASFGERLYAVPVRGLWEDT
jgi:predicted AAA+ superfamily ATPase